MIFIYLHPQTVFGQVRVVLKQVSSRHGEEQAEPSPEAVGCYSEQWSVKLAEGWASFAGNLHEQSLKQGPPFVCRSVVMAH